jgi:hypothetical protein
VNHLSATRGPTAPSLKKSPKGKIIIPNPAPKGNVLQPAPKAKFTVVGGPQGPSKTTSINTIGQPQALPKFEPRKNPHRIKTPKRTYKEGTAAATTDESRLLKIFDQIKVGKLTPTERLKFNGLVSELQDIFAVDKTDIGRIKGYEHKFVLTDTNPVYVPPYRVPFHLRPKVQAKLDDMLATGVIEPSDSPYSFPIVLVSKPDGDIRLTVDM